MSTKPKDLPNTVTVKIYRATHDRLRELLAVLARDGWDHFGVDSTDAPTYATVIAAAVERLARGRSRGSS